MERSLSLGRRTVMVLIASGLVASTAGLALADGAASAHTISGNVVYRERMLLPPGAIATVRLEDVSLADAPARVLAETSVPAHTSPTAFSLDYDPGLIEAGHTYALRAGITDSDQLMFTTTERHTLIRTRPALSNCWCSASPTRRRRPCRWSAGGWPRISTAPG